MTLAFALVSVLSGGALLLSSCASIIHGSKQKVEIRSRPPGAAVRIDGTDSGVTPTTAELSRKSSHRVELSLKGHKPFEVVLEPEFNGTVMGNILAGGLIGMAVDGSTGAGNTLKPEAVDAELRKR
jgi:hypothetical protein